MTPAERCTILEARMANLQRELATMQEQLDAQGALCEVREKRLRQQMNGDYQPCEGPRTPTLKEPVRVMEFHQRVGRAAV